VHREGSSEALLTELIVTSGGWKLAATCGSEVVANSLLSRSLLSSAFLIKKKRSIFLVAVDVAYEENIRKKWLFKPG